MADPEARARLSAAVSAAMADPEIRARHAASMADPEVRARISARTRATWANPDFRERFATARADPQYKARIREARERRSTPQAQALKRDLLAAIEAGTISPVEAARRAGVSKTTMYDWMKRHAQRALAEADRPTERPPGSR